MSVFSCIFLFKSNWPWQCVMSMFSLLQLSHIFNLNQGFKCNQFQVPSTVNHSTFVSNAIKTFKFTKFDQTIFWGFQHWFQTWSMISRLAHFHVQLLLVSDSHVVLSCWGHITSHVMLSFLCPTAMLSDQRWHYARSCKLFSRQGKTGLEIGLAKAFAISSSLFAISTSWWFIIKGPHQVAQKVVESKVIPCPSNVSTMWPQRGFKVIQANQNSKVHRSDLRPQRKFQTLQAQALRALHGHLSTPAARHWWLSDPSTVERCSHQTHHSCATSPDRRILKLWDGKFWGWKLRGLNKLENFCQLSQDTSSKVKVRNLSLAAPQHLKWSNFSLWSSVTVQVPMASKSRYWPPKLDKDESGRMNGKAC